MKPLRLFFALRITLMVICAATVTRSYAFTLEECVATALKNNPDLQERQLNLNLAGEEMAAQNALNFGTLDFVSSCTHYNLPRTLVPMTPASVSTDIAGIGTTQNLFSTMLTYEVALFTGFAQTRAVEIAALQKKMAAVRLELSREQLVYNVRTLYVNILSRRARKKAQISYVAALRRLHDDIKQEVEYGKKARIDLLKAAADLKRARAELAGTVADIRILRDSLAVLLNTGDIPELHDIDLSPGSIVSIHDDFTDGISALRRLRAGRLAVLKNSKLVEKAGSHLYPKIVLNASCGRNYGPNDDSNINSGDWKKRNVWQAGLVLKWNIFDFGKGKAGVRKAGIVERQSRYELVKTELELKHSIKEAVIRINAAVSDYKSAGVELAMTREAEAIEQVRYESGASGINDLLYAKARNQLAESRFTGAAYGYKTARFYLDYLLEHGDHR